MESTLNATITFNIADDHVIAVVVRWWNLTILKILKCSLNICKFVYILSIDYLAFFIGMECLYFTEVFVFYWHVNRLIATFRRQTTYFSLLNMFAPDGTWKVSGEWSVIDSLRPLSLRKKDKVQSITSYNYHYFCCR